MYSPCKHTFFCNACFIAPHLITSRMGLQFKLTGLSVSFASVQWCGVHYGSWLGCYCWCVLAIYRLTWVMDFPGSSQGGYVLFKISHISMCICCFCICTSVNLFSQSTSTIHHAGACSQLTERPFLGQLRENEVDTNTTTLSLGKWARKQNRQDSDFWEISYTSQWGQQNQGLNNHLSFTLFPPPLDVLGKKLGEWEDSHYKNIYNAGLAKKKKVSNMHVPNTCNWDPLSIELGRENGCG